MAQLPVWVLWPQAIALILIPVIGAWIAYKQVRIAEAKLNLDLFEKRFKVFDAARTTLMLVVQHGDILPNDLNKYYVGILDSVFLFDEGMEKYLEELGQRYAKGRAGNDARV